MKVLVACEFSGRVREAFARRGHHAVSCDLIKTELPVSENSKHFVGDVRKILDRDWDMIIAFPPCTYLARVSVRWLKIQEGRWEKMLDAVEFFNLFLSSPCPKVCIENPIMHGEARSRLLVQDYTQKVQPYSFGHPEQKATCFWLKGLSKLKATEDVQHIMRGMHPNQIQRSNNEPDTKDRQKNRSRTYLGIAEAMAEQWG
jgi:hypothetical protein